ncbi:MAG: hypothetical protein ACLPKB_34265 [Xanthobacteraceae bacterium]
MTLQPAGHAGQRLDELWASLVEASRWVGVYTSRVLKGKKLANLPGQQVTKVEVILNLKTAKALGLRRAAYVPRAHRRGD